MPTYQFESKSVINNCGECPCLYDEFLMCNITKEEFEYIWNEKTPDGCPLKKVDEPDNKLFDTFYVAYPKHIAVGEARKAFKSQNITEKTLEKILSAIIVQKANGTLGKDKFTPHPASWLRGRRWEDEVQEPVASSAIQNAPTIRRSSGIYKDM